MVDADSQTIDPSEVATQTEDLLGSHAFVIPEGLDFINSFFIFLFIGVLVLELIYLVLPMSLKKKVELIDFDKTSGGKITISGMASLFFVAIMLMY